jgi:predicted permease
MSQRSPAAITWLQNAYRLTLRSFPPGFQDRYGRDMYEAFTDSLRQRRATGKSVIVFSLLACGEALVQGLQERWAWREVHPQASSRHSWEFPAVRNLIKDIRYAVRGLFRTPGFAAVAILTLALGIGANSAIFSVLNGVVLKPLPYPDSDELVMLWHWYPEVDMQASVSVPAFQDYQEMNRVFSGIAAMGGLAGNLTGAGEPVRVRGAVVTADFFRVLTVEAALGRTFAPEEDVPGADQVLVLSDRFWHRQFGGDPGIIGREIQFNDLPHTVVGVMPADFGYPAAAELWRPAAFTAAQTDPRNRGREFLAVIARTKPGVTFEQAEADMASITAILEPEHYSWTTGWRVSPMRMIDNAIGGIRPMLWTLFAAVVAVLLITCVNVANLLLARAASRDREVAVRVALGGGRLGAIRHALAESIVLSVIGGVVGLGVASVMLKVLVALNAGTIPRIAEVSMDVRVLAFTFAVALGTGILFGALPALRAARANPRDALAAGGAKSSMGHKGLRAQRTLVVAEVALALMLLVGAGLMVRSFDRLLDVDPGFEPDNVLALDLTLSSTSYPGTPERARFIQRVLGEMGRQPGINSVAAINALPLSGRNPSSSFGPEGYDYDNTPGLPQSARRIVSPGYFETVGINLIRGRDFTEHDMAVDAPPVIIVDQHTVTDFWPDDEPLGKWIAFDQDGPYYSVVGVVGDIRHQRLDQQSRYHIYTPLGHQSAATMTFVLRGRGDPALLSEPARQAVKAVDPSQAVFGLQPMAQYQERATAPQRFNAILLLVFAGVALVLAAVGVYGVMSYAMSRRTQEIGIRMALGAEGGTVLRQLVGRGVAPAIVGVGIGLAGAVLTTRFMASLLFGVSPTDPLVMAAVAGVLLAVGVAACYVPARRATRIDPMEALRYE